MARELSTNAMARLFSLEVLASVGVFVFVGGMAWSDVVGQISALKDDSKNQDQRDVKLEDAAHKTDTRLERIEVNQEHFRSDLGAMDDTLKEQRSDIKDILKILRDNNHKHVPRGTPTE